MTYYETQQQNPMHNSQFNPQQWAAFNSQAAQPYAAWPSAPLMQAFGGYGLGGYGLGQAALVSNTANMAVSRPPVLLDTTQDGARNLRAGANSSNLSGAASNSASFRNRT